MDFRTVMCQLEKVFPLERLPIKTKTHVLIERNMFLF